MLMVEAEQMKKINGKLEGPHQRVLFALICIIWILILVSAIVEIRFERWHIFFLNLFALLLTFLPLAIRKIFSVSFPREFQFVFFFSLLLAVLFEKFFAGFLVQVFFGMMLGFVGFILMYILYYNNRMKTNYLLITLFSFCFSVSLRAVWEVFRNFVMVYFDLNIGDSAGYDLVDGLFLTMVGASIFSVFGYIYLKLNRGSLFDRVIGAFLKKNPKLFTDTDPSKEYIMEKIKKGESETLEFKSTLRTNLHTKQHDKKIEMSVMKTIDAFLNTDGGTLLVGVSDDGQIMGIKRDGLKSKDRFHRHFTNMVKNYIGNEYLPYIRSEIVPIDDEHVLNIDCDPSAKAVFLKVDNAEEFYVRTGPSSVKVEGSKLITYIDQRF